MVEQNIEMLFPELVILGGEFARDEELICQVRRVDSVATQDHQASGRGAMARRRGLGEDKRQHKVSVRHGGRRDALRPGAEGCRFQEPAQR